jgi:hypothetical protein
VGIAVFFGMLGDAVRPSFTPVFYVVVRRRGAKSCTDPSPRSPSRRVGATRPPKSGGRPFRLFSFSLYLFCP